MWMPQATGTAAAPAAAGGHPAVVGHKGAVAAANIRPARTLARPAPGSPTVGATHKKAWASPRIAETAQKKTVHIQERAARKTSPAALEGAAHSLHPKSLSRPHRKSVGQLPRALGKRPDVAGGIKEMLADDSFKEYARECFERFDVDKSGSLSVDELVECVEYMNSHLGIGEFRERDVAHYMRRFDINSDGSLSEEEFEEVYRYLLVVKLNEEQPTPFCRNMFLGRRMGQPSDHYDILAVVGKGSFGVVSKVLCKESRAARVLKTVDKEAAMKSGLPVSIVMEEIDKLKALDHPAILRLFEYYVSETALHLITDHLSGGELGKAVEESHLKKTPLREPWVRSVFHQVSAGVCYIHSKGVMHRDLKLENIMLGSIEPPEAIIIDVGLAELFPTTRADTYHSSAPTGSIPTMAPEVLMQSSTYKCDVWSLGCCLFGLVCLRPMWFAKPTGGNEAYPYPFQPPQSQTRLQLENYLQRQKAGPNLLNTRLEQNLTGVRDLIKKMLTFSEQARPTMKQVLSHPWLVSIGKKAQVLEPEQLDCLVNFQRNSALEEAVLLNVASQLPLDELAEFRQIFREADLDHNGKLDCRELAEAMQKAGLDPTPAREAAKKFARVGPVEFSRFVAALVPSRPELLLPHLKDAFNRLDTDGDGCITAEELQQLLTQANLKDLKAETTANSMFEALGGCDHICFEMLKRHFSELSAAAASPEASPAASPSKC